VIRQEHHKEGDRRGQAVPDQERHREHAGADHPSRGHVALAEIAESAKEGLLALAVGAGLQVMETLMEESVTALAGPKHKHNSDRTAVRHGHEQGSVILGGRRIRCPAAPGPCRRRLRRAAGGRLRAVSGTELLGRLALERMLGGLSTRRDRVGLEPVGVGSTRPRPAPHARRSRGGLSP
jgi:hypothetical protein